MNVKELEEMRNQLLPDADIEDRILFNILSREIVEERESVEK